MECRAGCGACCIAPSISTLIPGMPAGKPASERCIQLTKDNKCKLFGKSSRPKVCEDFKASEDVCGSSSKEAMVNLEWLETKTGDN